MIHVHLSTCEGDGAMLHEYLCHYRILSDLTCDSHTSLVADGIHFYSLY